MSPSKGKALQMFVGITRQTLGVNRLDACELLAALDQAGLVMMPVQPTSALVDASLVAMRKSRRVLPVNKEAAQRVKHEIRYRAMVEKQRESLGLASVDGTGREAAARAIAGTLVDG